MADAGVKKATVLKEDLPAFSANTLGYFVRYRIVSNDKNRYSHWSPYYFVIKEEIQKVACSVTFTPGATSSTNVVSMVWKHPKLTADSSENEISVFKTYDIYLKTNLNDWSYIGSSSSTQFSTLLPSGISSFQVAVQVPVYPKTYNSSAAIFTLTEPLVV